MVVVVVVGVCWEKGKKWLLEGKRDRGKGGRWGDVHSITGI